MGVFRSHAVPLICLPQEAENLMKFFYWPIRLPFNCVTDPPGVVYIPFIHRLSLHPIISLSIAFAIDLRSVQALSSHPHVLRLGFSPLRGHLTRSCLCCAPTCLKWFICVFVWCAVLLCSFRQVVSFQPALICVVIPVAKSEQTGRWREDKCIPDDIITRRCVISGRLRFCFLLGAVSSTSTEHAVSFFFFFLLHVYTDLWPINHCLFLHLLIFFFGVFFLLWFNTFSERHIADPSMFEFAATDFCFDLHGWITSTV